MTQRVSNRLNEGISGPTFYPAAEILAALNEAERFFCLLSLALEATSPWTLAAATPFTHMLPVFPDWIAPLRLTTTSGLKVRPARLDVLGALDSCWLASPISKIGSNSPDGINPARYTSLGADLVGVYGQPATPLTLKWTYARAPVALVLPTQVQEIPEEYAPRLVEYAVYRCRQVESAQELEKSLKGLASFLDGAAHYGNYVRARNKGARYDKVPFELESYDRSKLLRLAAKLAPNRKIDPV